MATIYLSSTYEDLKDYRRAVVEALRQSGHHVIGMEDYVATHQRPVDECFMDVAKAELYVGLFAFRYGYVPPPHHKNPNGLSITELEFLHAESLKKPCLTFIAKRDVGIPLDLVDAYTGDGDKGTQIERLRQYLLTEKLASEFSQPYRLAALVLAAVTKHLETKEQPESPVIQAPASPATVTWDIKEKGSPYPGLLHFTRKYAPVFFGRDAEICEILDRLRGPEGRFILISGDSGVGKSSVVDAGILPKLEQGGLPGGETCECVRMLPSQGQQPWHALLAALGSLATRAGLRPDKVIEDLTRNPDTLPGYLMRIVKDGTGHQALVLFLDQMEELFTAQDPVTANQFLAALYRTAQEKVVWVLATIRSDQLHHCHRHPDMVTVLRGSGHYPVGPVESFMLNDMIVKPARCAGLRVTDRLARRIVEETGTKEGNLPLLGFVLEKLFEKRTDHELREDQYQQLGGVAGAIGEHVKTVEARIEQAVAIKADRLLPDIFQALARVQKEEGIPTRNRPLLTDFTGSHRTVVDLLITERLLRTEGEGEAATVSLSHERLFEAWPALKDYVDTHKKVLVDRTLLESRARKWAEIGKPWLSGLASGREYKDFLRAGGTATSVMKNYLAASRRAQWLFKGAVALALLMVAVTTWLWQKGYNLDQAGIKVQSLFVGIHVDPDKMGWMKQIDGGSFKRGDVERLGEPWRNPVRPVTIKPFAMGIYEVTFEEYDRFAIAEGKPLPADQGWGRGRQPVINVSWEDAKAYALWLSQVTGKRYRLPTESEWEYVARSGPKQEVWAGTIEESKLGEYAVFVNNSKNRTAEVGGKQKNDFGFYDLSGNVWEWVEDCLHGTYDGAPNDGSAWLETDGGDCGVRVIRGGSWYSGPVHLRASNRGSDIGFRLAQDPP
ncbi:MAG: SUMF1/EgtB/PvdO family nonheme iron enzyme [Nitrospirota bacterium]